LKPQAIRTSAERALLMTVLLVVLAGLGCSPEASRVRGGGPGADVGNHSPNLPAPSTAPTIR
jgi:hypothetical protein